MFRPSILTAAGLLVPLVLPAQVSTGSLRGRVSDPAGRPLAGARLQLASPALFQPRIVVTDARGDWIAELLPVGTYTLVATREEHRSRKWVDLRVGLGTSQSLSLVLMPMETVEGAVEVTAAQAFQAKSSDVVAANFAFSELNRLPVGLSFQGAMALSPGVSGESIRGAGALQTLYRVDGIDIRDDVRSPTDLGQGSGSAPTLFTVIPDSIEDIQVLLSDVRGRAGRAIGGSVNILTRTGGNTWSGSLRAYYRRASWTTNQGRELPFENDQALTDAIRRSFDATLSGPVVKDRLWFALNARFMPGSQGLQTMPTPATGVTYGNLNTLGALPAVDAVIAKGPAGMWGGAYSGYAVDFLDAGRSFPYRTGSTRFDGKLTAALGVDHTLGLTFFHSDAESFAGTASRTSTDLAVAYLRVLRDRRDALSLTWNALLGRDMTLEASLFHSRRTFPSPDLPGMNRGPVPIWHLFANNLAGNASQVLGGRSLRTLYSIQLPALRMEKDEAQIHLKKLLQTPLGLHELTAGLELEASGYDPGQLNPQNLYTGGWYYDVATGEALFPAIRFAGGNVNGQDGANYQRGRAQFGPAPTLERGLSNSATARNRASGAYVGDTWTLNDHWNASASLRLNRYVLQDMDDSTLSTYRSLDPRFGIRFDPAGDSRQIFSLSWSRSSSEFLQNYTRDTVTSGWQVLVRRGWTGAALGQPAPGAANDLVNGVPMFGVRFVTYAQLMDPGNWGDPYSFEDARAKKRILSLRTPVTEELTFGYRRTVSTGWLQVSAVQKQYRQEQTTSVDYGYPSFALVKDPTGNPASVAIWDQVTTYLNNPETRTFRSLEFSWQERLTAKTTWGGPSPGGRPMARPTNSGSPARTTPP